MLVLLVGAAFVAGGLLARQPPREDVDVVPIGEGSEDIVHFGSPLERPEELPEEEPDVCGVVTRCDGNSLFLGKGAEPLGPEAVYEEPEVEVVVTHDTEIYGQTIEMDFGADTTERRLEPATLDDITKGTAARRARSSRSLRFTLATDHLPAVIQKMNYASFCEYSTQVSLPVNLRA